jgi:hypothetical protein
MVGADSLTHLCSCWGLIAGNSTQLVANLHSIQQHHRLLSIRLCRHCCIGYSNMAGILAPELPYPRLLVNNTGIG